MERLLFNHTYPVVRQINSAQHGFMPHHHTTGLTYTFSKAFDYVPHGLIAHKPKQWLWQ